MNAEKIQETMKLYRTKLMRIGAAKKRISLDIKRPSDGDALSHYHAMLDEIEKFLEEGRVEKAMRWLGFVQDGLWRSGLYSIAELAEHNRPEQTNKTRFAPNTAVIHCKMCGTRREHKHCARFFPGKNQLYIQGSEHYMCCTCKNSIYSLEAKENLAYGVLVFVYEGKTLARLNNNKGEIQ